MERIKLSPLLKMAASSESLAKSSFMTYEIRLISIMNILEKLKLSGIPNQGRTIGFCQGVQNI